MMGRLVPGNSVLSGYTQYLFVSVTQSLTQTRHIVSHYLRSARLTPNSSFEKYLLNVFPELQKGNSNHDRPRGAVSLVWNLLSAAFTVPHNLEPPPPLFLLSLLQHPQNSSRLSTLHNHRLLFPPSLTMEIHTSNPHRNPAPQASPPLRLHPHIPRVEL